MFNWIREWLEKRRQMAESRDYTNGYFYAHEELRAGGPSAIKRLRACIEREVDFGTNNNFERGVEDAIRLYLREHGLKERIKLVRGENHE